MDRESQLDPFDDNEIEMDDSDGDELTLRWLECRGDPPTNLHDFPVGGLLRAGDLSLLFSNAAHHASILSTNDCCVQLFGYNFDPSTSMLEKQDHLFQMARKLFTILECDALKTNANIGPLTRATDSWDYSKLREQLCMFFSFVRSSILSIPGNGDHSWLSGEVVPQLSKHLTNWRLLLQGFSKLPNYIIGNCSSKLGNKCPLASHHLFHAHLELRWYHLTLLYALVRCEAPGRSGARQALEKDLSLFLTELTHLSESCYASVQELDKFSALCLFPCSCVREMWLLLQLFADKLYYKGDLSQPFWSILEPLLRSSNRKTAVPAIQDCSQLEAPVLGQGSVGHSSLCLSLFLHLTRLYGYTDNGLFMDLLRGAPVQEAGPLLEVVLRATLPEEVKEVKLREVMQALLVLPPWWPTGTEPLLVLWEVFLKRISSAFLLPSEPPNMLAVVSKSASGFASQAKQYVTSTEHIDDGDNSFCMFLKLLGHQLGSVLKDTDSKQRLWKQLRGRIYPKFAATRMQTMSELGLYNLSALMLTAAIAVDIDEVGCKLQQMLESLPAGREVGGSKRGVVWRAHLALILLRAERGLPLGQVAQPVALLVAEACNKMTQHSSVENELMRSFTEALHDIAEAAPSQDPGLHAFVGGWLPKYLAVCNTTDACRTLDSMQALASRLGNYQPTLREDSDERLLFARLREYLLPVLVQQSQTPNPPAHKVADLAVSVALAANNATFNEIFSHFVTSENVNVRVTARFLTHLLPNEEAMERTKFQVANYHNVIIQAWVKCCLLGANGGLELAQLTGAVARLPQLVTMCGGQVDLLLDTDEPLHALAQTLASRLQALQSMQERKVLKDQTLSCLGRIDRVAEAALKYGKLSSALVLRLYQSTGRLVQALAPLLYTKAQTSCLLKGLITQLLLPMTLLRNPDLPLMPDVKAALVQTLPLFMRGIAALGPRQDAYVTRTIRELTEHFVWRLAPTKHGETHPLLVCFDGNPELSGCMMESIKFLYLTKKSKALVNGATQALRLVQQLMLHREDDEALVLSLVEQLVEPLLCQLLYLQDNSSNKHLVSDTLKEVLNCPAFRDNPRMQEVLTAKLGLFYRNMPFHATQLFRTLTWLASMRRGLLLSSLPALRGEVAKVENLRGSGRDAVLRTSLDKLETQLGVVGTTWPMDM